MTRNYDYFDQTRNKWTKTKPGEALKGYLDSLPYDTQVNVVLPNGSVKVYRVNRMVKTQ